MKRSTDDVRIKAHYADCCFCSRRDLEQVSVATPYRPRFNFRAAAQELASKLGVNGLAWNTAEKGAIGTLPEPCDHRLTQTVRITWELIY